MAISANGDFVGSVSGGCIEGAVVQEAESVLQGGPSKRLEYGITNEQAWEVGLSCGGQIVVFVEPLSTGSDPQLAADEKEEPSPTFDWFSELHATLRNQQDVRSITITESTQGALLGEHALLADTIETSDGIGGGVACSPYLAQLAANQPDFLSEVFALEPGIHRHTTTFDGRKVEVEVFLEQFQPAPRLVIVGAVHIAEHLVHFAQRLGFHCTVIDARAAFATTERFAHADELIVGWPGDIVKELPLRSTTYCAFLTHDPKLDDPAILAALAAKVRYIGALGSRKTHAQRCERLAGAGATDTALQRIDAPIGLHLGGRKPEEIALAIAAKLVAVRAGSGGR